MIFNTTQVKSLVLLAVVAALCGCPGKEENRVEEGISVHFAEIHQEASVPASARSATKAASGGYDHGTLEHHHIIDQNGRGLSLYRTYLVIDNVSLIPCTSLAQLPAILLDALVDSAYAHAGHGSEPVGGRALDKPNVIDLITQDDFLLPLGDMAVASGRYCGLQVEWVRLAGDAYGKPEFAAASADEPTTLPEIPDLAGLSFAMRADYCAQYDEAHSCVRRVKVDIDDRNLQVSGPLQLDFSTPLELNGDLREAYVALGIAYADWVHDVDVTRLTSDTEEVRKLQDNIRASLYVHAKGLGELPPNLTE